MTKKNQKIIIGNWKMNPLTVEEAKHIVLKTRNAARKLGHVRVIVCPPFPFITLAATRKAGKGKAAKINDIKTGAQNVFFEEQGAFTGEVSARELADLGVSYVIVGHSERRAMGETDMDISKKAAAVVQAGMMAVLCIGEKTRGADAEYLDTLREEIKASLQAFPKKSLNQLIIAYEPIWAIGARQAMTPDLVREMAIFIKKVLSDMYGQEIAEGVAILYGGSVNFRNASDIITQGQVDGLLVGRESVNVPGFVELLKAVDAIQ